MTMAGERINELLDELLCPMEGMDKKLPSVGRYRDDIWYFAPRTTVWAVDLAQLSPVFRELTHLLYDHPRREHEVDDDRLLILGMAMGKLMALRSHAGKDLIPQPGEGL